VGTVHNSGRWQRLRAAVLARDERVCYLCGGVATTVDHVLPVSRGGAQYDPLNCRAACARCNYSKGARVPDPPSRSSREW